ncbi:MAG TPA: 4'-phosphopantetheinyl transferase superfamily protein [bacterium]|nr:4'-phosphopantetheinyl transferase superfamily protein [bacterium]
MAGLLRRALASRLAADPGSLVIERGAHGKPYLGGAFRSGLAFNLSHSGDRLVIAIGKGRELGVDVELIRPLESEALAERYFSKPESIVFRVTPPEKKEEAFFHYWTAKEAYLKAKGVGIGQGLKDHSFSDPWENPPRLTWAADPAETGLWRFHRFYPEGGYIGTLAYPGDLAKIREFSSL